ncbi:hypothetical protein Dimus_004809 [Dionaea muscipula]
MRTTPSSLSPLHQPAAATRRFKKLAGVPRNTHSSPSGAGTPHPPPPPSPLEATAIVHIVLTTPSKDLSKTLLDTRRFHWSNDLVDKTLKRLWNHGPLALKFFNILDHHCRYSHSSSSFDLAVDIAARLREYKTLWTLISRMHSRHLGPNPRTFAIVMERYVAAGKPDRAVRIFLSMHKYGCPQDLNCFNTLLDVLCKSKRVEKAQSLVRVFRGRFKPDVVSYNIIADGWCLIRRTPKALEVLKEMVEKGLSPTSTTFNIMLKGYLRAGQVKEAWEFFLEMKRRKCCEVDVVTYTTLVHGFGVTGGDVNRAMKVFDEMVKEGRVLPSVATYNALIQVLCKKDSVEKALMVFEEMTRKGYVANSITYNLLIRGLCHVGEMQRAVEFMARMEKDEECELPNVQTYNLLIRYYCDEGELEKGVDVFEKMMRSRRPCLPNLDTYNILIRSMFVRKKAEDLTLAGKLLIEMVDRGFLPRRFTFNRVLNGLFLTGNQAFAKEILSLQSRCGRLPRHFRL